MIRDPVSRLIDDLASYCALWPEEARGVDRFISFLRLHPDAFSRSCIEGHVTGSAFVVDPAAQSTLFVHHARLDRWLQPGGHCEEGENALEASRREAFEETGIELGQPVDALPFDIDIHLIPARGETPDHLHFDVRYLFVAPLSVPRASEESYAVEWLPLVEAGSRNPETSVARPLAKIEELGVQLRSKMAKQEAVSAARPTVAAQIGNSDPLHGKTLEMILNELVARHGWTFMAERIPIRCFEKDPSVKSSLVFLRRTPWARAKVEALYLGRLGPRR